MVNQLSSPKHYDNCYHYVMLLLISRYSGFEILLDIFGAADIY